MLGEKKHLTTYGNSINTVRFVDLSEKEMNLFVSLLTLTKNDGNLNYTFDYEGLREIMAIKRHCGRGEFAAMVESAMKKLLKVDRDIIIVEKDEKERKKIIHRVVNVFQAYSHNVTDGVLEVNFSPLFRQELSDYSEGFTQFELEQFLSVSGKYAKILFRMLKQFKYTQCYDVGFCEQTGKIASLEHIFGLPEDYPTKKVKACLINPAVEELRKIDEFKDLSCRVEYSNKTSGAPVKRYIFTWSSDDGSKNRAALTLKGDSYEQDKPKCIEEIAEWHKCIEDITE